MTKRISDFKINFILSLIFKIEIKKYEITFTLENNPKVMKSILVDNNISSKKIPKLQKYI